jgi:hypothetical protein
MEEQQEFVRLVDAILAEFERHGYPRPPRASRNWRGTLMSGWQRCMGLVRSWGRACTPKVTGARVGQAGQG